ncbi:NAD-dependent epimerase/dehydratase family protein [Afipia sp. P52-10]|uniref:NAD-dependent epimerase/dehydratase family protein n=1 Tax=Afipia sp. P52-10 TaxID=1429916 RepID=UPI0009DD9E38|nr:NAD-dependent epimerase/dehydratase family protein [Afipia sp. P52-10]
MPYRILVTGASGFIGSALVNSLSEEGHDVVAAVREPERFVASRGWEWEAVRLPDLSGPIAWERIVEGADIVVHLAGIANRGGSDDTLYDRVVHLATAELADACLRQGVKRLIFMSSIGAQTGSFADHVVTEGDDPQPVTAYDRAKLAAERAVERSGMPYTILRPVIVYGPGAKGNIALFLRLAESAIPLPFGRFNNLRSYVARENLVKAIVLALDSHLMQNETFIVADPEPISLADAFTVLRQANGRPANLVKVPSWIIRLPLIVMGRRTTWERISGNLIASSEKLQKAGWNPRLSTRDGLAMMIQVDRH